MVNIADKLASWRVADVNGMTTGRVFKEGQESLTVDTSIKGGRLSTTNIIKGVPCCQHEQKMKWQNIIFIDNKCLYVYKNQVKGRL
jgi:hypothetical protein